MATTDAELANKQKTSTPLTSKLQSTPSTMWSTDPYDTAWDDQVCTSDSTTDPADTVTVVEPRDTSAIREKLRSAQTLLQSLPASDPNRVGLEQAIATVQRSLSQYDDAAAQGTARQMAMAPLMFAGTAVLADDATGVGVADDILLPFIGAGMLLAVLLTRPTTTQEQLDSALQQLSTAAAQLDVAVAGAVLAVRGPQLAGNTRQLAVHLARLLGLSQVGGQSSGEPPDDNNNNHWWTEIKTYLKNIRTAVGKGSRRQVDRELLKQGITEAQIAEIEAALIRAAQKMGEPAPPFLP